MDMITYAALQKQMQEVARDVAVPEKVSAFENDAGYQTAEQVDAKIPTVPGNVGAFENDAGYQTETQVQEKVLQACAETEAKIPTVPTKVSAFSNDAGYQTETQVMQQVSQQVTIAKLSLSQSIAGKQDKLTFDSAPTADSQNPVTSGGVYAAVGDVIAVANGKCKSYVFDTVSDLETWLADSANTGDLKTGDVFLIRDVGVPDYWWDAGTGTKQILETTKVDLSEYALQSQLPTAVSQLNNDAKYQSETQVQAVIAQTEAKIPTVPTAVSAFENDAGYQTAEQVQAKANAVEAKIPTVPTNVSAFTNDAGYQTAAQVTASAQAARDAATEIFYVPLKLGATGFELDGVTYAEILTAYNAGKRIIGKGYVPSAAGLGVTGNFELPLTYLTDSNEFVLNLISGMGTCEAWICSDNTVSVYPKTLQDADKKVTSVSAESTDEQYPSAKAVYGLTGGLSFRKAYSAKPASPAEGDVYYDTAALTVQTYTGGAWSTAVAADANTVYFVIAG